MQYEKGMLTAVAAMPYYNHTVIFVGTHGGQLLKVMKFIVNKNYTVENKLLYKVDLKSNSKAVSAFDREILQGFYNNCHVKVEGEGQFIMRTYSRRATYSSSEEELLPLFNHVHCMAATCL